MAMKTDMETEIFMKIASKFSLVDNVVKLPKGTRAAAQEVNMEEVYDLRVDFAGGAHICTFGVPGKQIPRAILNSCRDLQPYCDFNIPDHINSLVKGVYVAPMRGGAD